MNKWAVFAKVKGVWRFEGFVEEAEVNREKQVCEQENGPDSYRAHLFVDDSDYAARQKGTINHDPTRDVL